MIFSSLTQSYLVLPANMAQEGEGGGIGKENVKGEKVRDHLLVLILVLFKLA